MIKITFDKESEFVWLKYVIENGVLNLREGDHFVETFKKLPIHNPVINIQKAM